MVYKVFCTYHHALLDGVSRARSLSDAPQIPKAPRDARWRDAFVLAMIAGIIGVGILVATACCSLDAHTLLAAGATALFAAVAAGPPARAVATLIVAALAARLRAAPPTASVEACFYAVHEAPQGAECASPMVYRRAARLAADARAASGPRGVQRGLLISPRRGPSESEDHADQYADSPERATTATTRDGLTLL